jgi:3-hydroxyacyl-[acyl-carrier-protein] dehydratase
MSKTPSPQSMNIVEITKILPHRHPFIFVDRVLEKTWGPQYPNRTGNKIRAIKNVTINEPYFEGHFPHRPVMPGVIVLEVFAQVGALLCCRPDDPPQDVAFVGVNEARFRKPISPGDQLVIEMDCRKDRGQILIFGGTVKVDDEIVAEAEILAKVFPLVES